MMLCGRYDSVVLIILSSYCNQLFQTEIHSRDEQLLGGFLSFHFVLLVSSPLTTKNFSRSDDVTKGLRGCPCGIFWTLFKKERRAKNNTTTLTLTLIHFTTTKSFFHSNIHKATKIIRRVSTSYLINLCPYHPISY